MSNGNVSTEMESMNTEFMQFDVHDTSIEELERRLEMAIVSAPMNVCDADCPKLGTCTTHGNCGVH